MAEWKRICCAIDFSDSSRLAMQEAADLARRFESDLTLVHVYEAPEAGATDMLASPPELFERASRETKDALERWRAEAEGIAGHPVRAAVQVGDVGAELARSVSDAGFDLVVMGTHGRRGFRRMMLGSVAERVVRRAACSVLVVRGPPPARGGAQSV
jgi:nucleotide-binding universal stress UspA family protein